jgi:hypothetical protein
MTSRNILFFAIGCVLLFASGVFAQICPGSHLHYVVRAENGKIVDAEKGGISVIPDPNERYRIWEIDRQEYLRGEFNGVPDDIKSKEHSAATLEADAMCNFAKPVKLTLASKGKIMQLTFLMPKMDNIYSGQFVVDSLPFRPGKYEIKIETGFQGPGGFYAAKGWKKVD